MKDQLDERATLQLKADGKIPRSIEGDSVFYSGNAGYLWMSHGELVQALWRLGDYTVRMSDGEYAIDDGYGVLCSPNHVCRDMPKARITFDDLLYALETVPWEDNKVHFISRRCLLACLCVHAPKSQRKRILATMAGFREPIK